MSSTRRTEPGGPLRQERWMSSKEYERGLLGNAVARRCQVLDQVEDRETVWFLQKLSQDLGSMVAVANAIAPGCLPELDHYEQPVQTLPGFLTEMCLNPERPIEDFGPCPGLIRAITQYRKARARASQEGTVVTEIGKKVGDALDYAMETKCLVLIEGNARMGKTFAAKAWCEQRPHRARFAEVPSTNDDVGFFKSLARSLGVGSGHSWKAFELRQRVEDVLFVGDLILVLDEAHYLWPVTDCRRSLPGRINWIMTALANRQIPVALVTTPQFIASQKAVEKHTHWTSEQFIGRIGHYEPLPKSLSESDLSKVAKAMLVEGDAKSIELLVRYAQGSAKYLAGIESIVRRARYLAKKESREKVLRADIKKAIRESVIPSDSALADALSHKGRNQRGKMPIEPTLKDSFSRDFNRVSETEFSEGAGLETARGLVPT